MDTLWAAGSLIPSPPLAFGNLTKSQATKQCPPLAELFPSQRKPRRICSSFCKDSLGHKKHAMKWFGITELINISLPPQERKVASHPESLLSTRWMKIGYRTLQHLSNLLMCGWINANGHKGALVEINLQPSVLWQQLEDSLDNRCLFDVSSDEQQSIVCVLQHRGRSCPLQGGVSGFGV